MAYEECTVVGRNAVLEAYRSGKKIDKLYSIPGKVPNPINMPHYCYFKDRCDKCIAACSGEYPHEIQITPTHSVACYRYYEENKEESK